MAKDCTCKKAAPQPLRSLGEPRCLKRVAPGRPAATFVPCK